MIADAVTIRAGSSMRTSGGQVVGVAWAGTHPEFNPDTMVHDVALLRLSSALDLDGASTRATALAAAGTAGTQPPTSGLLTVSGWGTLHVSRVHVHGVHTVHTMQAQRRAVRQPARRL